MKLVERIDTMCELGRYLESNPVEWQDAKQKAFESNAWFTHEFIELATKNIIQGFLQKNNLTSWTNHYYLDDNINASNVGIVMAGNIPMVGFHDLLSVFISGHRQTIKLSSKDEVLIKHITQALFSIAPAAQAYFTLSEMLKGCDAYIATGSNNSARYFDQYFGKYPNIIRRNRTSVALLKGNESDQQLSRLADDVHLYFGLGCRNITKLFVPKEYDFVPLLKAFDRYKYFADHHKYKNNYDYRLSIALLNKVYYMTNGSTLLIENNDIFSPISQLNYRFYDEASAVKEMLEKEAGLQCIVGLGGIAFGQAQSPGLMDYADGVDTMQFLLAL